MIPYYKVKDSARGVQRVANILWEALKQKNVVSTRFFC